VTGFDPVEPEIDDLSDPRSPLARTLITTGVTIVVLLVVVGLLLAVGRLTRSTETVTDSFTADPAQPLRFVVENLDVRVVSSGGEVITVEADVTSGWLATDYAAEQDGGTIRMSASCFPLLVPGCGGVVTIGVPAGSQFELDATDRDVELAGIDGIVTVSAGSGDVRGVDLAVFDLGVSTTSGDVDLTYAEQPYGVKAATGDGDVRLSVPSGELEYDLVTEPGSGDVTTTIDDVDGAEGFIAVQTGSGDIRLGVR
jgi:hypothetical protein